MTEYSVDIEARDIMLEEIKKKGAKVSSYDFDQKTAIFRWGVWSENDAIALINLAIKMDNFN